MLTVLGFICTPIWGVGSILAAVASAGPEFNDR